MRPVVIPFKSRKVSVILCRRIVVSRVFAVCLRVVAERLVGNNVAENDICPAEELEAVLLAPDVSGNDVRLTLGGDESHTVLGLGVSGIFSGISVSLREDTEHVALGYEIYRVLYRAYVTTAAVDGERAEKFYQRSENGDLEQLLFCHIFKRPSAENAGNNGYIGKGDVVWANYASALRKRQASVCRMRPQKFRKPVEGGNEVVIKAACLLFVVILR